ncbi:MAG: major capsid family protein [Parabacteroides sp.]
MGKVNKSQAMQAMDALKAQGVIVPSLGYNGQVMDATGGIGTGMAFLIGELEKQDPRLLEPMTSITAPRDIDMVPGGGWVDITSNAFVHYATTGSDEDSIGAGETNNIPISTANISKDVFKVHTFMENLAVPIYDELKLQQIGKSLSQILDDGLRLNFNKLLDRNVYVGISKTGTYGLVNNPLVTATNVALNEAGTSRSWAQKTTREIMNDVNIALNTTWAQSEYDLDGMADHVIIDTTNFSYIVNTPVTLAGTQSILEYLLKNNIATAQGRRLEIFPSRWCGDTSGITKPGVGGTNRMVAYVKRPNRVAIDLPVPLSRIMQGPDTNQGRYVTLYAGQFSQTKILAPTAISYFDGI